MCAICIPAPHPRVLVPTRCVCLCVCISFQADVPIPLSAFSRWRQHRRLASPHLHPLVDSRTRVPTVAPTCLCPHTRLHLCVRDCVLRVCAMILRLCVPALRLHPSATFAAPRLFLCVGVFALLPASKHISSHLRLGSLRLRFRVPVPWRFRVVACRCVLAFLRPCVCALASMRTVACLAPILAVTCFAFMRAVLFSHLCVFVLSRQCTLAFSRPCILVCLYHAYALSHACVCAMVCVLIRSCVLLSHPRVCAPAYTLCPRVCFCVLALVVLLL